MGIRKIQMNRAIEKIVKHYLYNGKYPTFQTITHHLSYWLRGNTPGAPSFKPLRFSRKEKSDSNRYNENVDMIYTDISDAYEATIEQTNRIMTNFNYNETERGKLWHELSLLSNDIDELLLMEGGSDFIHFEGKVIGFSDMNYVDGEHTTAMVDVGNKQVTLKENIALTKKIQVNPKNVRFKPLFPTAKTEALQTISQAFDGNTNSAWWQVVKTKTPGSTEQESSMGMRAELTILFDEEQEFNEISYISHHGKPVFTKIEYTMDGYGFSPLPDKNNNRQVVGAETWQFQKIQAKGIKFLFEKKEHDDRSAGVYQFYFGAKEIGILNKSYMSTGLLYTDPIIFDNKIQKLSLQTKEEVPFNCTVDYEVALYKDDIPLNELTWFPISSYDASKPKYAKVIEVKTKNVRTIETDKAEATGQVINGMQVFRLLKDNGDGIVSEITTDYTSGSETETFDKIKGAKLFRGINQWRRESAYVPFTGEVPINNKWAQLFVNTPSAISIDYKMIDNKLNLNRGYSGKKNYYRFSTCIYSEDPMAHPLGVSVIQTLAGGKRVRLGTYSVYVNNERLVPANDEVTMQFKKGWNEVQVLFHWGDMQLRTDMKTEDLPNEAYLGKFNFSRQKKVRADLAPITYTDTHSLYYNISPNNRDFFSIHERQMVLNYLPKDCIFQLVYEADIEEDQDYLYDQVIVRATLNRATEVVDITPRIQKISLRAK